MIWTHLSLLETDGQSKNESSSNRVQYAYIHSAGCRRQKHFQSHTQQIFIRLLTRVRHRLGETKKLKHSPCRWQTQKGDSEGHISMQLLGARWRNIPQGNERKDETEMNSVQRRSNWAWVLKNEQELSKWAGILTRGNSMCKGMEAGQRTKKKQGLMI